MKLISDSDVSSCTYNTGLAEESFHLVCDNVHSAMKFPLELFVFNPCGHFRGSMDNSAILFAPIETCNCDAGTHSSPNYSVADCD